MKYKKVVFHIFAKMFKSQTKEKKKIISLLTTIQFLKSEAATTVRSKNDKCLLCGTFNIQSKYPSKVSAMKVIKLMSCFLFFALFFYRTVVAASYFNNCTMINCDLVNKF